MKVGTHFYILKWVAVVLIAGASMSLRAEVILQYFNTSWNEIADRMPELVEAGYDALWLPPPFKAGAGIFDVGFGTHDRFDLGDKDQMGTVKTKYGTRADLLHLMEVAHRFGVRVYFDNVMAHNGGPTPGYDENSSIHAQPGFVPEDFHIRVTEDGFYRPMPGDIDWNNPDEWRILNRNPFGLDIAQEDPNTSFGPYEGATFPKYRGVRHPDNPEYYPDLDLPIATNFEGGAVFTFANKELFTDSGWGGSNVGAGNGLFDWDDTNGNGQHNVGETSEPFTDTGLDSARPGWTNVGYGFGDGVYNMGDPVEEDVNQMLFRAIRWFTDLCHVDGFRLDAVKHVPFYFFGKTSGADKDYVNWGYNGQVQEQFNITHGFSDWNNHRDTVYNDQGGRDDAMLYGEHLGGPPAQGPYLDSGMRLADDGYLNSVKDNIGNSLSGMDQPGYGTQGSAVEMLFIMSHDNNHIWDGGRMPGHALMLMAQGFPIVYTDGYNQSGPPDWFPKPAYIPFLGQWGRSVSAQPTEL